MIQVPRMVCLYHGFNFILLFVLLSSTLRQAKQPEIKKESRQKLRVSLVGHRHDPTFSFINVTVNLGGADGGLNGVHKVEPRKCPITDDPETMAVAFLKKSNGKEPPDRSSCPKEFWYYAMSEIPPYNNQYVFVNIGFNKGYNFALWFNFFTSTDMHAFAWYTHVWKNETKYGGVCDDYKENFAKENNSTDTSILFVGVELNNRNIENISAKFETALMHQRGNTKGKIELYMLHGAGGSRLGQLHMTPCDVGDEECSVAKGVKASSPAKPMTVPIVTVDAIMDSLHSRAVAKSRSIDILKIDTEGEDPVVLDGTRKHLREGRVRCVIFEYHSIGAWNHTRLKDVVDHLDGLEYACYFQGQGRLWAIYKLCWVDAYEIRRWSNVMCIKRNDIWHHAIQSFIVKKSPSLEGKLVCASQCIRYGKTIFLVERGKRREFKNYKALVNAGYSSAPIKDFYDRCYNVDMYAEGESFV